MVKKKELQDKKTLQVLFDFVQKNWQQDPTKLAFKKELVKGVDNRFVLQQLYGKHKAKTKLPFLFNQLNSLYPPKVSVEQSTSQAVAEWKTTLVNGDSLVDITGGFGVDSYYFSKTINQVTYLEQQSDLYQIVQHNFQELSASNIHTINDNAITFLKKTDQHFDWIYVDPARRDGVGNRKIGLADYVPNVLTHKELLFQKGNKILLKTSPMLDIRQAILQLDKVVKVYVVALKNEVKELLFEMDNQVAESNRFPIIQCINLASTVSLYTAQRKKESVRFALPKTYLYEPNAAILKAGLFQEIAQDFEIEKLHPNTHLYTSDHLVSDFPGRIFLIKSVLPYQKKAIAPYVENSKANISTRNFPYTVAQMKKKLGIKDGGNCYLFGVTLTEDQLKVLVCEKVKN